MKKILALGFVLAAILSFAACGNQETEFTVPIVVPAGSTENFVYSEEEISPRNGQITVYSEAGLGDTLVTLRAVQAEEKTAYEPTYITHGMPTVIAAETGGWFQIGVDLQNPTDEDITVYITVKDVDIRIR